ncbi:MAG: hypothetical protein JNM89_08495 [Hyphomicrobiaceae bacterium]|nr:hypothetical protein [Hyphomicrobiaceae bacterium]
MPETEPTTFWEVLAATPVAAFVRENAWAYPLLETLHMLGLALLVGGIVLFDLRLLGRSSEIPVRRLACHILPWVWIGFAINLATGALLFSSDAAEFAANASFRVKIVLIALAGINAAVFQRFAFRDVESWDRGVAAPPRARVLAMVSLVLWIGVVTAGRMMAYLK